MELGAEVMPPAEATAQHGRLTAEDRQTAAADVADNGTEEAGESAPADTALPSAINYISLEDHQIWRLEADNTTASPITSETEQIMEYDVSPVDGTLTVSAVSGLLRINADGSGRTMLVETNGETAILKPTWSPDGQRIAYGMQGNVYLIDPQGGEPRALVEIGDQVGGYIPLLWSPDGTQLVVLNQTPGTFVGSYLIVNVNSGTATPVQDGADGNWVCCTPAWSPDGSILYFSNHMSGFGAEPALWQVDPATGTSTLLIDGIQGSLSPESPSMIPVTLVGFAQPLSDGNLYAFMQAMTGQEFMQMSDVPVLTLTRLGPDGITERSPMRSDAYPISEALWSPDGSGAAITVLGSAYEPGTIIWIPVDGSPALTLNAYGTQIKWTR
jgi:Tol biopolymer transport system component